VRISANNVAVTDNTVPHYQGLRMTLMGFNIWRPQSPNLLTSAIAGALRPPGLLGVGVVPRLEDCPYDVLSATAKKAFLELKVNLDAPDKLIFSEILGGGAAAALGKYRVEQPTGEIDTLSLNFVNSAESGTGKSSISRQLLPPFKAYDDECRLRHANVNHEGNLEAWKRKKTGLGERLTSLIKKGKAEDADVIAKLEEELKVHMRDKPAQRPYTSMIKKEASIASIIQALEGSDRSVLLTSSEGEKLMTSVFKDEQSTLNEIFDGSPISYTHARDNVYVKTPLLVTILQLRPHLLNKFIKRHGEDAIEKGFFGRCFFAEVPEGRLPNRVLDPSWENVGRLNEKYGDLLRGIGQHAVESDSVPLTLKFEDDAKFLFSRIRKEAGERSEAGGPWYNIRLFVRRAPQLMGRLAAVLHLISDEQGTLITVATLKNACHVVEWYLVQAQALFVDKPIEAKLEKLVAFLKKDCFLGEKHFKQADEKYFNIVPMRYVLQFHNIHKPELVSLLNLLDGRGIVYPVTSITGQECVGLDVKYFSAH
jgi:hypothetical protein